MALTHAQVTVSASTPTVLAAADPDFQDVVVKNMDGAIKIYLGDATLDANNGFELAGGATVSIRLHGEEVLYAVAASGSPKASVLRSNVGV